MKWFVLSDGLYAPPKVTQALMDKLELSKEFSWAGLPIITSRVIPEDEIMLVQHGNVKIFRLKFTKL